MTLQQKFNEYIASGDITISNEQREWILPFIERCVEEERASKDGAYRERDMLVCALSKVFPSYLARHSEEDSEWENDWRWIVYINIPTEKMLLPTGNKITRSEQISWHIHDSEREMFNHLEVRENNWDGHNTERKYQRLQALQSLTQEDKIK